MYAEYKNAWAQLTGPGADFEVATIEVRGNPTRIYAKAPNSLVDVWQASAAFGDRDYLVYKDERLTYSQAHAQVANIGAWLQQQGVQAGDRVGIAMRNYPEWLLSYWGILNIGATVVGMNAWWTAAELDYALEDAQPKVLIADPERLERLAGLDLKDMTIVGVRLQDTPPLSTEVIPWQSVVNTHSQPTPVDIDPDADACIFYTSGTTGRPKGAQLTHRGCVHNIWSMMFAGATLRLLAVRQGLIAADEEPPVTAALVTTPLFHVTANNCVAHGATLGGGKLVHMYKWDAGEALTLIEKEGITHMTGVPVMAREVIAHPNFAATDTSTLLSFGGGGAQLQPDLVSTIDSEVATARPNTGYGMTETCGIITSIGGDFFINKPDSCGPAMPCYESKIVDAAGNELPVGEAGELLVRGAQVIRGYLNREDATAETIQNGWLRTGDVARKDEDDFLFIVDRIKDMVLRGGENIYCAEVESALFEHGAVAECSVFGVPDDRLGEEVGVAVFLKDNQNATADELRAHCQTLIAGHKVPRYVWITQEPLPRNASGKFLKRELRERLKLAEAS